MELRKVVGIAEGKTATGAQVLISYALGSCVGICLYDRSVKVAGMAHVVLPAKEYGSGDNPYKFADEGIRELIREMGQLGAQKKRMTAKIAGGAKMFESQGTDWDVGAKNVQTVKTALEKEGIPLVGEDTGKNHGRTIQFSAADGTLEIRTIRQTPIML